MRNPQMTKDMKKILKQKREDVVVSFGEIEQIGRDTEQNGTILNQDDMKFNLVSGCLCR